MKALAATVFGVCALVSVLAACGGDDGDGTITADGSSTVRPFVAQAAEQFAAQTDVRIDVGITGDVVGEAGTAVGLERFCAGEIELGNASRPMTTEERALCSEEGTEYVELRVATDAVTNVVSKRNDWATCLTVAQLEAIWKAGSDVRRWRDVDPSFPPVPIELFAPGPVSGTFDFFTSRVLGPERARRSDYSRSSEQNTIVGRVADERGSLGYVGHSYYDQNRDRLRALEVDAGGGCVAPEPETAQDGTYPLSRPLFVYVNRSALEDDRDVREFVEFMLEHQQAIAEAASFVPLRDDQLAEEQTKLEEALG
jgi:phosphate transport system substrate-binding protein